MSKGGPKRGARAASGSGSRREQVKPPTFGGSRLFDPAFGARAGGAFGLVAPPRASQVLGVDGWQVEVIAGFPAVIARGGIAASYEDAFQASLLQAQRGLDLMSMYGANNLVIKGIDEDHLVWWPEPDGLAIRAVSLAPVSIDVPPVRVEVRDAQGNLKVQLPPPPPTWHESFRYFRLSQTTDDLFDSYRNLYLALESILDRMAPQIVNSSGKAGEREGQWFKRALGVAHGKVDLGPYAPKGSTNPVEYLFNRLYVDTRTALFHAKSSRPSLLPHA